MKKNLLTLLSLVLTTSLMAYSDSDLDGVDDSVDKCPGTPLSELVDITGCPKKTLISPHHYDIVVGMNYADTDDADTVSESLQVDYFYKDFSIQASTSYYQTSGDNGYDDSGFYDTFIGAAYQLKPSNALTLRVGIGALLPTYDSSLNNNNTDYTASLSLSYALNKSINLFGGYIYTLINDDDYSDGTNEYNYQNTNAYSGGIGFYLSPKVYLSASYNSSESVVEGLEDIETATGYMYVSLKDGLFTTLSYTNGLSDTATDNYLSFRIGRYF